MATAAEVTVICIDNSIWLDGDLIFDAQLQTIKFYCETKFKCNPENRIGLFVMGSLQFGSKLFPTSDLQQILHCLQDVHLGGKVEFSKALGSIWDSFSRNPQNMKRRLLMFVGSPIHMDYRLVEPYAVILREGRIALDIVNFFVLDTERTFVDLNMLYGTYHYARSELVELVNLVNVDDNSHIIDVDESNVHDILSKIILKKNLRYLRKKDQRKTEENVNVKQELELSRNEKNKAAATNDVYVKASGIQYGHLTKETRHLSGKKKEVKENVNVKQELEVSCSEKNRAAGEYGNYLSFVIDLKRNEKVKLALEEIVPWL